MASGKTAPLPSMPGTVVKLLKMFSDPDVGIDEIVDTVKTDAALVGKVLKAANSTAKSTGREVTDLKRAAMLLGKKSISMLALSFSVADPSLQSGPAAKLYSAFWYQSMSCGAAATVLARHYGGVRQDEAFLIGLLSRFGRLGAITLSAAEYEACLTISDRCGCALDSMVITNLGMSCEEITLQYLRSWMLPEWFVGIVENMQKEGQTDRTQRMPRPNADQAKAVSAATLLRAAAAMSQVVTGENSGIALATLHELLIPEGHSGTEVVDSLLNEVLREVALFRDVLNMDVQEVGSSAEIYARAMSHLAEVATMVEEPVVETQESLKEITWLKGRVSELADQLTRDSMTSIRNRAYFDKQLERTVNLARGMKSHVSVLFVDINKFKHINDTFGHDVGDEAIRQVASYLSGAVREIDVLARYGGDEFVILCEMNCDEGLLALARRLAEGSSQLRIRHSGGELSLSLAIGGAIGIPDDRSRFAQKLMNAADQAMYVAKRERKEPVVEVLRHEPEFTTDQVPSVMEAAELVLV